MTFLNDFSLVHFLLVQTFRVASDPNNDTSIFSSSNFVTCSHVFSLDDFLLVETVRINSDPNNPTIVFSLSNRPTFAMDCPLVRFLLVQTPAERCSAKKKQQPPIVVSGLRIQLGIEKLADVTISSGAHFKFVETRHTLT